VAIDYNNMTTSLFIMIMLIQSCKVLSPQQNHRQRTNTMHRTEIQATQQRVVDYSHQTDSITIFNLLTGKQLFDQVESLLPEHRERLYPPTEALSMFIAQVLSSDGSCQQVVNQSNIQRNTEGLKRGSSNTGAYCKARNRLDLSMLKTLAQKAGQIIIDDTCKTLLWKDHKATLVDGMTVTLPDTKENQKTYPQLKGQKQGIGFPICRIVALTDLSSGALIDVNVGALKGKGSDEQSLSRPMLGRINTGDILLGDAYYPTYFLLASLKEHDADGVFEQLGARLRVTDFTIGTKLGHQDHIVLLTKPKKKPDWLSQQAYDSAPPTLQVRELKKGKGKTLITTLLCHEEYPKKQLIALYQSRWQVELDIRNIKTTMGMEYLRCKTPEMAVKEIWVYMLAYNLIRIMMVNSALLADLKPRQISFKHALQIGNILQHSYDACNATKVFELLLLISEIDVGNRPGRIEPRALKRRMKAYPLLMEPRNEARSKVRLNGHPRKKR